MIPRLLATENLACAVRRGNTTLLGQASAALAKWRANGTLQRTLQSHMPHYQILTRMQPS